ncbi:MAG: IS1595 family transposase [Methyloprofundus sp.]|nr:IS1595 family transposase [Methyloprofundus sp.]
MQNENFQQWLSQATELTIYQKKQAFNELSDKTHQELTEEQLGEIKYCPHCASPKFTHWGQSNDLPRYRCKACLKTFNVLTGTPLARLRHKSLWLHYADMMLESSTIRKAASELGIDKNTSFRWRHRFLISPTIHKPEHLTGIVEADETFFLESHKGEKGLNRPPRKRGGKATKRGISSEQVPVLIIRDRSGITSEAILPRVTADALAEVLTPLLDSDAILCSDGHRSYQAFSRESGISHRPVNLSAGNRVIDKAFHVQNVNAYDSRLKSWMIRFHGVATKYLDHYLGWQRWLDSHTKPLGPQQFLLEIAGANGIYQQLMQT